MDENQLLDAGNLDRYLRDSRHIAGDEEVEIQELAGGVSNVVLYVRRLNRDPALDFVVKQARHRLRVPAPWFCTVERIFREIDVLECCGRLASRKSASGPLEVRIPRVLFMDRDRYAFAMSAVPLPHHAWKHELLEGSTNPDIARACGRLLGEIHAGSWNDEEMADRLHDRQIFDDLRLDPFYRALAREYSYDRAALESLIEETLARRLCLVHADFSPKNLILRDDQLTLVDYETGHYGDPAFDLGFFLSHLVLKAIAKAPDHARYLDLTREFWREYRQTMGNVAGSAEFQDVSQRAVRHFAGCIWARVGGKSRVDYLPEDAQRRFVAELAHDWIRVQGGSWDQVAQDVRERLESHAPR